MSRTKLVVLLALLVLLLVPHGAALARKRVYKASLSSANELHQVVGANATGSAVFGHNPDGSLHFLIQVRGLSGPPSGTHIHGPATTSENGPIVVTLCGNPAPAAVATCPFDPDTGSMTVEGDIPGHLIQGMSNADFFRYLNEGLLYVNVHTSLNPAGETRGQIFPR